MSTPRPEPVRPPATPIPILRIEGILIASIQQALDDDSVVHFEGALLERVVAEEAAGVVIDITAVDVVDSFMARSINDIAVAVGLLGAKVAVVGIQPPVAVTLVRMGFTIPNAVTALDLEQGLRVLRARFTEGAARHAQGQGDTGRA